MFVHANLPVITAYLREDVLYNMDVTKADSYVACTIIAVSSYPGSVPTFQVVVEGESLFSYIPPHLIISKKNKNDNPLYSLSDLVYHNCPAAEFSVNILDFLIDKKLQVFLRSQKTWLEGNYQFTMDWYLGNDLLHCVTLNNGQFAFIPQHKLSLGKQEFKAYQKLRQDWKV